MASLLLLSACASDATEADAGAPIEDASVALDVGPTATFDAGRDAGAVRTDAGRPPDAGPADPEVVLFQIEDKPMWGPFETAFAHSPRGGFFAVYTELGLADPRHGHFVRLTATGEVTWTRSVVVPSDSGFSDGSLTVDPDSGNAVFAYAEAGRLVVVRIADDGTLRSSLALEAPGSERFTGTTSNTQAPVQILAESGGSLLLAASIGDTQRDVYLTRLDPDGTLAWQRRFRSPDGGQDAPTAIVATPDDGYLLLTIATGFSDDGGAFLGFPYRSPLVWALRLDHEGVPLWSTVFGTSDPNRIRSAVSIGSGGFVMAGRNRNTPWFVRMRPDGLVITSAGYVNTYFAYALALAGQWIFRTPSGRLLFTGADAWLFEVDREGTLLDTRLFDSHVRGAVLDGETLVTLNTTPPCHRWGCAGGFSTYVGSMMRHGRSISECTYGAYFDGGAAGTIAIPIRQSFVDVDAPAIEATVVAHAIELELGSQFSSAPLCLAPRE